MYPEDQIKLADNPFAPKDAPDEALTNWGELRGYHGMPGKGPMPDDLARKLIRGYYACVSYTDAMIGKVLDELDRLGLSKNTIVVLWGDHGWKLGDHGMWCKHTNFEMDTHVPMIISVPGMKARGKRTGALTEFVDIYPTLCELCGLEQPAHLEGVSIVDNLNKPEKEEKRYVGSVWPHSRDNYDKTIMGYAVKDNRYNYVEWVRLSTGEVLEREFYDHDSDPMETRNVIGNEQYQEVVGKMAIICEQRKQRTDHEYNKPDM